MVWTRTLVFSIQDKVGVGVFDTRWPLQWIGDTHEWQTNWEFSHPSVYWGPTGPFTPLTLTGDPPSWVFLCHALGDCLYSRDFAKSESLSTGPSRTPLSALKGAGHLRKWEGAGDDVGTLSHVRGGGGRGRLASVGNSGTTSRGTVSERGVKSPA